jgi:hypothetical protein
MAEKHCGPKRQDVIGKRYRWMAAVDRCRDPSCRSEEIPSMQHFGQTGSKL